jgi:hypothetical protein
MRGDFEIRGGGKVTRADNLITAEGRDSLLNALINNDPPGWTYLAVGLGTSAPGSAQTTLDNEIFRDRISGGWIPQDGTARLVTVINAYCANGPWGEVGIFSAAENRTVLNPCEGTAGWSSNGVLTQETGTVHWGQASLRTQMTPAGTLAFLIDSGGPMGTAHGTADYLQFWYRTTDVSVGTLTVRWGDDASNYYQWDWAVPDTGWNLFATQVASGSQVGTPGTVNDYFRITHGSVGSAFYEYLDHISVYGTVGTMMTRGTVSHEKDWNTVTNVYYSIKIP